MKNVNLAMKWLVMVIGLILADVFALVISFLLAYWFRADFLVEALPLFGSIQHSLQIYAESWPILLLWPLMFLYEGIYPSVGMNFWEENKSLVKGNLIAFIFVILLTFITRRSFHYSRFVIALGFMISLFALPLARILARKLLRLLGVWRRDIVLVGSAAGVGQVMNNLNKHPDWGFNALGAVLPAGESLALPVLGELEHLENVKVRCSEVIVAMPGISSKELSMIVEKAATIAPVVKVLPDLYGLASAGVRTHDLDGMLLLEVEDRLALRKNIITKRFFDVVCAVIGLILLSPFFLITAMLVRLSSRGPVFFGHTRVGQGGKPFKCYKFRTMVANAQEVLEELLANDPEARAQWEAEFKLKNDPRITRIGGFLRKTSLDEFPQLWNVIRGDMSLVGPRPIVSDEVDLYGDKARYFFKVTPGITGLWQVSGRNDIDYDERVMLDEYYAKNWSLWLDIEILIRTFGVVLNRSGAY